MLPDRRRTCRVLIGSPEDYRECGLPHDPCTYHRHVEDAIRSDDDLRRVWDQRRRKSKGKPMAEE